MRRARRLAVQEPPGLPHISTTVISTHGLNRGGAGCEDPHGPGGSRVYARRLRELFEERGVSPATSLLAESFDDDVDFEFGVVATSDRRVYQFGFYYHDLSVEEGVFIEWVDLSERYADSPYRDSVAVAFEILAESTGPVP